MIAPPIYFTSVSLPGTTIHTDSVARVIRTYADPFQSPAGAAVARLEAN
ncbi:MAG: hypothetical protein WCA20_34920 [Candidatus Sulfotelmatobacter sp.]